MTRIEKSGSRRCHGEIERRAGSISARMHALRWSIRSLAEAVREASRKRACPTDRSEIVANAPDLASKKGWSSIFLAPLIARDLPLGAIVCRTPWVAAAI